MAECTISAFGQRHQIGRHVLDTLCAEVWPDRSFDGPAVKAAARAVELRRSVKGELRRLGENRIGMQHDTTKRPFVPARSDVIGRWSGNVEKAMLAAMSSWRLTIVPPWGEFLPVYDRRLKPPLISTNI